MSYSASLRGRHALVCLKPREEDVAFLWNFYGELLLGTPILNDVSLIVGRTCIVAVLG